MGRSQSFAQAWSYAYRDGGVDAVYPKKQPGRVPRLAADRVDAFKARINAGPTETDGVCTLRGRDLQRILKEEFAVELGLQGVYVLLRRIGYACLKPRPQHRNSDPEAQRRWLERAPLLSRSSGKPTRTSASRSGSWTRPASASRVG